MASKFYGAISHIGGADGDLDAISAVVLTDGDGAVVLDAVNDTLSMYTLVGTSSEVNDAVNFTWVKPTDAATPGKRWKQVEILTANLDVAGTLTAVDADFSGDVTADTLELGGAGVVATDILNENDMASDSATALASQQSIKAYVNAQLTAEDLDVIGDTGGAISIDLDSETLTLAGGTGIASVSGTNTVTFNIDSTVATLTGSQVLTNKTLTSPVLNTGVSGTAVSTDDTLAADSDTLLPSQSAVKGYVDGYSFAVGTNAVDSDAYVDGSIDLAHMSANSVDSDQYVDGSIDLAHMSANSVDSAQYVDGSIDLEHLADNMFGPSKASHGSLMVASDGATETSATTDSYVSKYFFSVKCPAGPTVLRAYARLKNSIATVKVGYGQLTVTGVGSSAGGSKTGNTYTWLDLGTVDMSGATPATVYAVTLDFKADSSNIAYVQGISVWWE